MTTLVKVVLSTVHVKLPKLFIKRFGGDLTKWTTFWAEPDTICAGAYCFQYKRPHYKWVLLLKEIMPWTIKESGLWQLDYSNMICLDFLMYHLGKVQIQQTCIQQQFSAVTDHCSFCSLVTVDWFSQCTFQLSCTMIRDILSLLVLFYVIIR